MVIFGSDAKVHCLKELNSPYIIFYLHYLNLNDILDSTQTFATAEACLFFACRFMHMHASL